MKKTKTETMHMSKRHTAAPKLRITVVADQKRTRSVLRPTTYFASEVRTVTEYVELVAEIKHHIPFIVNCFTKYSKELPRIRPSNGGAKDQSSDVQG